MDTSLGSSLLPPGNPAAQAWSDLQKAAREKMIFCGVTLEVHLPEAGFWTAVAGDLRRGDGMGGFGMQG